jgi:uncharacterized protein (TIGR00645 family)
LLINLLFGDPATVIETLLERALYASRWLLAPIFMGLSLCLFLLTLKFFQEMYHILHQIFDMPEGDLILKILSLIDLALVGSLLIMVMFSGYENFVSRINIDEHTEKLEWLGKLDAGSLKQKVAASIVAISSIHLLRLFMDAHNIDNSKLLIYIAIHLTFVVSALLMGILDKTNKH